MGRMPPRPSVRGGMGPIGDRTPWVALLTRPGNLMSKAYYIIGTDTNCGKTIVTGAIAAWLRKEGRDVGVFKPFEAASNDSQFLKEMSGSDDPLSEINPYHFDEPLAPGVAAERAKKEVSFETVKTLFQKLKERHEILLVEGAGGLLVPLVGRQTHIELLQQLKIPVLLVARLGLGTLNHTLLTLSVLRQNKIECAGVILNETVPQSSVAETTNPDILERHCDVPLLGTFPFVDNCGDPERLAASIPANLPRLTESLF